MGIGLEPGPAKISNHVLRKKLKKLVNSEFVPDQYSNMMAIKDVSDYEQATNIKNEMIKSQRT